MPITKSAKKALRQSLRRQARNLKRKKQLGLEVKQIKKLAASGKLDEAKRRIPQAYKALDKAAKVGVIKRRTAARKKSRLMHLLKQRGGGA